MVTARLIAVYVAARLVLVAAVDGDGGCRLPVVDC